jgi:CDP-glucose 4,6-dehydratase
MSFWQGKRVLVTGHTGFKGAWLSLWLMRAGARVIGLSLPENGPALFYQLGIAPDMEHRIGDIRDPVGVSRAVADAAPDVVFHLAAQSLVLHGYRDPVETWSTNVMGTVHLLEALRALGKPCAAVLVTTDKVYENREWEFGYRESDPLGGHDPYSSSKAAAELAIACWRNSYLNGASPIPNCVRIASARAGNVIGGGDWAENRIVPDMVRALGAGQPVRMRNPNAVRPWQHILEPLSGYILLARRLSESADPRFQTAFNFGPAADAERTVAELVDECLRYWPGLREDVPAPGPYEAKPHESGRLALSIDRARARLGWSPRWDFARTARETMAWYRAAGHSGPGELRELSLQSIRAYEGQADATA